MLVHMHSQNYKSSSRMDTSLKLCYYGMKEELNGCRCHRFLNCSRDYLYGDLNLLLHEEVRKAELGTEALKHSSKLNDVGGSDQLKDLEGDVDERPSTPPDGEEEFTDDDGTIYKWDRGLRAWVPQENLVSKSDEKYELDEMTYPQEEELFPSVVSADISLKGEVDYNTKIVSAAISLKGEVDDNIKTKEAKPDAKRKAPEKEDKKE